MSAIIISGFPATGKSYHSKHSKRHVLDLDASNYGWIILKNGQKVRNPDFPNNYIEDIKKNMDDYDVILVSSHISVRKALTESNLSFYSVYPDTNDSVKLEFVGRMYIDGRDDDYINDQIEHWKDRVNDESYTGDHLYRLGNGKYIDDDFIDSLEAQDTDVIEEAVY